MLRLLSERIRRAVGAGRAPSKGELVRWEAIAFSMEGRMASARSVLEAIEPDDTYGAMMRISAIDALDGEDIP